MILREFLDKENFFVEFKEAISGEHSLTELSLAEYCEKYGKHSQAFIRAFDWKTFSVEKGIPYDHILGINDRWRQNCYASEYC